MTAGNLDEGTVATPGILSLTCYPANGHSRLFGGRDGQHDVVTVEDVIPGLGCGQAFPLAPIFRGGTGKLEVCGPPAGVEDERVHNGTGYQLDDPRALLARGLRPGCLMGGGTAPVAPIGR